MVIDQYKKDDLKVSLDDFFLKEDPFSKKETGPKTLISLAIHLGTTRDDLLNYDGKYKDIINGAKLKCQNDIINRMLLKKIDSRAALVILESDFDYKAKNKDNGRSMSSLLDEFEKESLNN